MSAVRFEPDVAPQARVTLAHGGGGRAMRQLIESMLLSAFHNPLLAPLEDLAGAPEQPNIPGTVEQHPNWRRRWPYEAKTMLGDAETRRRMGIIDEARRRD